MLTHGNYEGLAQTNFDASAAVLGACAEVDPAARVLAP